MSVNRVEEERDFDTSFYGEGYTHGHVLRQLTPGESTPGYLDDSVALKLYDRALDYVLAPPVRLL